MSNGRVLFCKFYKTHPRLVQPSPAARPITVRPIGATETRAVSLRRVNPIVTVALLLASAGCSELQARHHARAGNGHFQSGDYAGAVREYEIAEQAYPAGLPVIELNKGLACRQLMVPGAKGPEQDKAVDCALDAFKKMKELKPEDGRGDLLYVQTLFDADRFDTLVAMYEAQLAKDPNNLAAINSLINVHSRADHWAEALKWSMKRADIQSNDAEAQYTVGVMIYNRLFQKGGSDKGTYDPRPDPNAEPPKPKKKGKKGKEEPEVAAKTPPPFNLGDLMGAERARVSDLGIKYMTRAIELRPNYREAMGFMSLLYRQRSLAFLDKPVEWESCVNTAEEWRTKANQAAPAAQPSAPEPAPAATPT